jgi:hypothetical protein
MNGFLPTISLAGLSHVSFLALRRIRQLTFLVGGLLRRWKLEFRFDWIAMMNVVAVPGMKKSLLRWLTLAYAHKPLGGKSLAWTRSRPGGIVTRTSNEDVDAKQAAGGKSF